MVVVEILLQFQDSISCRHCILLVAYLAIEISGRFLKVKSQLDLQDLEAVVKIGLDVILRSSDNFFVQVSSHFVLQKMMILVWHT